MVIMAKSNKKNCNTNSPLRVGLYDIGEIIGEGNFATVRFARHRHTKSDVAIKIIDKTKLSEKDLKKVNREIQIMTLLNHPNIIKLYQVMKTETMLYLVTEYAPNGEIFDHIVNNGKLSETEARKKFWQILSAIEYCHNNKVVHRDLKAENLLLDTNGNIKIADFGFGNEFSIDDKLSTFCGSPPYAAPELFEGKSYKGPEVDIWSLGVVLYVLVCGGLPFYGENLRDLKDRVVKGMFRIPYWMSEACEHLIRRMLVRDPDKRYTIEQIKKHRWLLADGPLKPIASAVSYTSQIENGSSNNPEEQYNETVLRLMDQLGLERQKTIEQLGKNNVYDHYTAIYHLLLDRTRVHRSSYPLDKHPDCRQQRRPSTVADNALSNTKYLQHLHQANQQQHCTPTLHQHQVLSSHAQQQNHHQLDTESLSAMPILHTPTYPSSSSTAAHVTADYNNAGLIGPNTHVPLTSCPSYTLSIDTTYSTSAESGLEVDMETCPSSSPHTTSNNMIPYKPPLTRRHTLTGMTGIPTPETMLRHIGGPSIDSGNSMELPSESPSIESNLDYSDHNTSDFNNPLNNGFVFPNSNVFNRQENHVDNSMSHFSHNNNGSQLETTYGFQRQNMRSPINFREGRRASDGLVCQDVIAFRQKLKDGMKAGGMLELRQEHNQLMESCSSDIDNDCNVPAEPPVKIPLGKRMSLPTNSIDLPPHKLLEIKKSIQLDQHLATSQDVHEITHPFGPLRPYEPVQTHPFNSPPSLQRQMHNRSIFRKQGFKQQSALHQQFQQMHIEQTSLVPAAMTNMGRGAKHPPVARQPSYKLAQQQTVMPPVFHGAEIQALPWEQTAENGNFLLPIANTCAPSVASTTSIISSSTSVSTCISTVGATQYRQQAVHTLAAAGGNLNLSAHCTMYSEPLNNIYFGN